MNNKENLEDILELNEKDFNTLLKAIENPPEPNERLKAAMARAKRIKCEAPYPNWQRNPT